MPQLLRKSEFIYVIQQIKLMVNAYPKYQTNRYANNY